MFRNGNLILTFNNSVADWSNLSLGLSQDNGKLWSHIEPLKQEKDQQFSYPAIIKPSDGTLFCNYTNTQKNIKFVHFDEKGNIQDG